MTRKTTTRKDAPMKLTTTTQVSVDGVVQGNGGRGENSSGEFERITTHVRLLGAGVNSLGLGNEPSIEPVRRRLARSSGVRFKLDAEATWPPALVAEVAATGAVDTIDFKGQYGL